MNHFEMQSNNFEKICSIILESRNIFNNLTNEVLNQENTKKSIIEIEQDAYENVKNETPYRLDDIKHYELIEICEKISHINSIVTSNNLRLVLIKYIYPQLLLVGILDNALSLLIMVKTFKKERKENRNFSFCFSIVSLADLSILLFGCLRE